MKLKSIITSLFITAALVSCTSDDNGNATNNNSNTTVAASPGDFADGFLTAANYPALKVEILYETDVLPTTQARTNLLNFLNNRLNKPQGISYVLNEIPNQNKDTYSIEQVRQMQSLYRVSGIVNGSAAACLLFLNGNYDTDTQNSKTLGVAFGATSACIFQKTIRENTGGIGQPTTANVEEGIMKHEFGHLMGLVNLGTPLTSSHEDAQHPKHCTDTDCLMYYATETGDFFNNLLGGNVPTLDTLCLADLRANGGK